MMSCNVSHFVRCVAFGLLSTLVMATGAFAEQIDLRPESDTFVVDPGSSPPHAKMKGIQDSDFGGAGSRAVAAAAAHVSTATAPNNLPHGTFQSLLRFDASQLEGENISSAMLQLYTTRDMAGAKDIFNPKAQSGYFTVSLLRLSAANEWTEGSGTPETMGTPVYNSTVGTTNTILINTILPLATVIELKTFYFDASLLSTDPNINQTWLSYDLNCSAFQSALTEGGLFTLLIAPSDGDTTVSFNFQCRVQQNNGEGSDPTIWANGPHLVLDVAPEPGTMVLLSTALLGLALFGRRRHVGFATLSLATSDLV